MTDLNAAAIHLTQVIIASQVIVGGDRGFILLTMLQRVLASTLILNYL